MPTKHRNDQQHHHHRNHYHNASIYLTHTVLPAVKQAERNVMQETAVSGNTHGSSREQQHLPARRHL